MYTLMDTGDTPTILCPALAFGVHISLAGDRFSCTWKKQFKWTGRVYNEEESEWTGPYISLDYIGENLPVCPDKSDECEYSCSAAISASNLPLSFDSFENTLQDYVGT